MMLNHATEALKILGGVGLFFSFTEVRVRSPNLYLLSFLLIASFCLSLLLRGTKERQTTGLNDVFSQMDVCTSICMCPLLGKFSI